MPVSPASIEAKLESIEAKWASNLATLAGIAVT